MAMGLLIGCIVLLAIIVTVVAWVAHGRMAKTLPEGSTSSSAIASLDTVAPGSTEFENPIDEGEGVHELDAAFEDIDCSEGGAG